jgi:hypothetical protein
MKKGSLTPKNEEDCSFLVTPNFKKYMIDLLRAISSTDLPVLLEGIFFPFEKDVYLNLLRTDK